MTIKEIEKSLPNGFHDAKLVKIDIDYVNREGKFYIQVDIGTSDNMLESHESYRAGLLKLKGLLFCIIDPPDFKCPFQGEDGLWITDSGVAKHGMGSISLPTELPSGAFAHYFFINDWNSFIYFAAMDASFEWL